MVLLDEFEKLRADAMQGFLECFDSGEWVDKQLSRWAQLGSAGEGSPEVWCPPASPQASPELADAALPAIPCCSSGSSQTRRIDCSNVIFVLTTNVTLKRGASVDELRLQLPWADEVRLLPALTPPTRPCLPA